MRKSIIYWWNSFFGRIIFMVMVGIGIIAVTVSALVLGMSKNVFTQTYGKSQEKVFEQIEKELNDFHESLQGVVNAIDSSWAFRLYLSGENKWDNVQMFQGIYQMEKDLEQSKTSDMERMNILVLGTSGNHYLSRTETISIDDKDIWDSNAVLKALKNPEMMHYTFSRGAYTATTRNANVIIVSQALYYQESKEVYGVVLITLTMDDMKKYYDYFVTDTTSFYLVDDSDTIICTNEISRIGFKMEEGWYQHASKTSQPLFQLNNHGRYLTVMQRHMSYLGCNIYGITDNNLALNNLYNMPLLIALCAGIGCMILALCLLFARRTIAPLSQLIEKMSRIRQGNFAQYMPVKGTIEIQEIAATYNYMLDDIQSYIAELMDTQKKQRAAEIKALQMQINPHYIYNTLASIKWLVYQNNNETTIKTIDAFIGLLRNTISNTDEFVTVEQEIANMENYALINRTRYGEGVAVEFYISHNCCDCLLPKMILQPFIENAFFHAFSSGQNGTIQVFAEQKGEELDIRIIDDGIGMNRVQAKEVVNHRQSKEHFSGIGIHNVQERLKLLYGEAYGVIIESKENQGTTVTLRLPIRRKQALTDGGEII